MNDLSIPHVSPPGAADGRRDRVGPAGPARRRGRPVACLSVLPATLLLAGCASTGAGGPATSPTEPPVPDPVSGVHYRVFTASGARASLDDMVDAMATVDVVLVGEEHDDRIGHRLQAELLRRAFTRYGGAGPAELPDGHPEIPGTREDSRPVVLSLEMFERDVQGVVEEYLRGVITEEHFRASARPWEHYEADYRPLVEFARAHRLPVVAANAPRRYVNLVSREGREGLRRLSPEALESLPPLPYPEPSEAYVAEWEALMGGMDAHRMPPSALDAQALWDATMAYWISQALEEWPDALVLHMAGSFHVQSRTGIPEALARYEPRVRILVVVAQSVADVEAFDPEEHAGLGDFVILTARELVRATR